MKNMSEYLKKNGIKPSLQRIKIYEYLSTKKNHPTVDQVYNDLLQEMPTLSRTTVYNTFKLFLEKKIIMMITIEENEVRYDANTKLHGHFKCENCGKIYDFGISYIQVDEDVLNDFLVEERQLYFIGKCKNCLLDK